MHRGRPESGSGRVQGMVASFEHNGPSRPTSYINVLPVDSIVLNPERDMLMTTPTIETLASPAIINADSDHQKEPRLLPFPPPSAISSPEHSTPSPLEQHISQGSGLSPFGPYPSSQDFSFPLSVVSSQRTGATLSLPDDFSDHRQIEPGTAFTLDQQPQSFDALYMSSLGEGVRPLPLPPHAGQFYQPLAFPAMSIPLTDQLRVGDSDDGVILGVSGLADQMQVPHIPVESIITAPHVQVLPHVPDSSPSLTAQIPSVDVQHDIHHQELQPQPQLAHLQQSDLVSSHSPHQISSHVQSQGKRHHHQLSHSSSMPIQILVPQPRHGGRESPTKILEEKLEELLEPRPRSRVFSTSRPRSRVPSSSKKEKDNLSLPGSRPRSRVASMSNDKSVAPSMKGNLLVAGDEMGGEVTAGAEENMGTGSDRLDVPKIKSHHHHPRTRVISVSTQIHSHRLSGVEAWGENHRHAVVPSSPSPSSSEGLLNSSTLPFVEGQGVKELEREEEMGIEALLEKEVAPFSIPVPVHDSNPILGSSAGTDGADLKQSDMGIVGSDGTESLANSRNGSLREPKSAVITLVESIPLPRVNASHEDQGGEVGVMEESIEALLDKVDSHASLGLESGGALKRTNKKRTPLSDVKAWNMADINTVEHVDGDDHDVMTKSIGDARSLSSSELRSSHASQELEQASPVVLSLSPKELDKADSTPEPMRFMDGPDWTSNVARMDELERKETELEKSMAETRDMVREVQRRLKSIEQWISEKENEGARRAKEEEEAIKGKEQEEKGYVCWVKRKPSVSRVLGMLGLSICFSGPSSVSSPSSTSVSTLKTQSPMTLIRRIAKLGLKLSTYVALFAICVVFLRAFGKRSRFAGVGPKFLADGGELVFRGRV